MFLRMLALLLSPAVPCPSVPHSIHSLLLLFYFLLAHFLYHSISLSTLFPNSFIIPLIFCLYPWLLSPSQFCHCSSFHLVPLFCWTPIPLFLCFLPITPTICFMNINSIFSFSSFLLFHFSSLYSLHWWTCSFSLFLHPYLTLLAFLPVSLRPTGVYTPQTTSCCWRNMKACSQPPFRPSSPGELPHFKRKWIILWNEWRRVRQWQTHTLMVETCRDPQINIHTYKQHRDNCGRGNAKEKKPTHISIKILPTDTERDAQIMCKVFRCPSCLFGSLTKSPSPSLSALLFHCHSLCHSKNIYCAIFTNFYKQIKFQTHIFCFFKIWHSSVSLLLYFFFL